MCLHGILGLAQARTAQQDWHTVRIIILVPYVWYHTTEYLKAGIFVKVIRRYDIII